MQQFIFIQFNPTTYKMGRDIEAFLAFMRKNVKVTPMIIDGVKDDIIYDDYDDDRVVATEEEIDEKYPEIIDPIDADETVEHDEL